jgi:myo-inositol-1(or 4)-monophosphatase
MARWQGQFRRWEKAEGEPVCEIDLAVDVLLRERLRAIDPEAGWLSEETADDRSRLDHDRIWVVDPIDGTRDYLRGGPGWAISVALIDRGRPRIGVLIAPARGESWMASAGGGATRNGVPLAASGQTSLDGARVPTDNAAKWLPGAVKVAKPNSIALRMAMVASGEADFVATIGSGHEWDIAAAELIATEAGAIVTDAEGAAIVYNSSDTAVFGMLAAAPGLHAEALAAIRRRLAAVAAESR